MNRPRDGFDVRQLQIDWNPAKARQRVESSSTHPVLRLRWDFKSLFPQPLPEAVDAGMMAAEDAVPQGIEAIHQEHSRKMLGTLSELDAAMERQRQSLPARSTDTLSEPTRLQRWYASLLGIYEDWFGKEAADAFDQAVRAWHARVEVVVDNDRHRDAVTVGEPESPAPPESPQVIDAEIIEAAPAVPRMLPAPRSQRVVARLPVPRPLPMALTEAHFGFDDQGKAIRPCPAEVREITTTHAQMLIDLVHQGRAAASPAREQIVNQYQAGIAAYAESFGENAAQQLAAYVQREAAPASDRRRPPLGSPGAGR